MTDREDKLDETIAETFPASDAPGNTVETGIRVGAGRSVVRDNRQASRFEMDVDDDVAILQYERRHDAIVFTHTEVPRASRGRGVASALTKDAVTAARNEGLRVIALCPFVKSYLKKHPDLV
jgi:predicted GNAT family acetyltransferase